MCFGTDLGLDALRNQLARQHLLDILDVALAGDAGFVDFRAMRR